MSSSSRRTVLAVALLCAAAFPQTSPPPSSAPPAGRSQTQSSPAENESRITPEQAQQLFRSVDEILHFASQDTGLPMRHEVKRALVSRDQVMKYVEARMDKDEDAQRLRRSELVLKKFGLLPRDFDLKSFLVALLREQVAGYYDPKTKTVNLLDWVDADVQKPVLAHELTHALQDQDYSLERWLKDGPRESKKSPDVDDDEAIAARQSVVEGQAMVVLTDYELAPLGKSILDAPNIVEVMKQSVVAGSPLFNSAPLYIKDSLAFPYTYGLDFERALLQKSGKEAAFAGVLQHPPLSTREVMQPSTYLAGEHLPALRPPNISKALGKDWQQVDVGGVGEFDTSVLLEQFAGETVGKHLWPQWRGGYYYAARRKDSPSGPVALVYVSRWAEPENATQFANIYEQSLKQKYKRADPAAEPPRAVTHGSGIVQVAIANAVSEWNTEDGPVFVEPHGDAVLVMESFDVATAAKLRQLVLPSAGSP